MKKLKKIIGLFLIGGLMAVVAIIFMIDGIVQKGIEKGGSYAMGVDTKVGKVSIGLMSGEFSIGDLSIRNPKGFEGQKFVKLGHVGCNLSMGSLLGGDKVVIEEISMKGLEVSLVQRDGKFNYAAIMDHLADLSSGSEGGEVEVDGGEVADGPGKLFVINKTVFEDVVFHLDMQILGKSVTKDIKLSKLELPAIGNDASPAELGDVVAAMVKGLIQGAVDTGGADLPVELLNDLKKSLADFDQIKGQVKERATQEMDKLKGKANKEIEKGIKKIEEEGGKAIGDLLKGFGQ